jgi:iron complex outermembrane receptor protein
VETLFEGTVLRGGTLANGQTINRRAVRGVGHSDGYGLDTKIEGRIDAGGLEHRVLAGVDMLDTEWRHLRDFTANVPAMPDIFDPVSQGLGRLVQTLAPQVHQNARLAQIGVYGQDQIVAGALRLTLGARYDWAKNHQVDELATGKTDPVTLTRADEPTWRVGATWLSRSGVAPYASYSTSFQPTTGQYFDGTPFKATTGEQYEAGVKFQPHGSNALLTAAAYQLTQNNLASPDPDPTHICAGAQCQVQTGQGRIRGVELEGKATLVGGLSAIATGTYMNSEVTRSAASERGNRLPQVPDWMGSLFADYRFGEGNVLRGVGLGGGVRYVGVSYGDTANAYRIPAYTLFDLFVRKAFADGIVLSVNARNLTNHRYVALCSSPASCFYGSGRTLNLRLQYRW